MEQAASSSAAVAAASKARPRGLIPCVCYHTALVVLQEARAERAVTATLHAESLSLRLAAAEETARVASEQAARATAEAAGAAASRQVGRKKALCSNACRSHKL
jgi:hypothetical protein